MDATPRAHTRPLRIAGDTHPGLVREHNEDRLHVDPDRGVLIVVDGLGGQAGGETAAETALGSLRTRLARQTGTVRERVREAITVANNEIFRLAEQNPAFAGMGCVLTVAVVEDGTVTVGHVGDSRLYKLRGGTIEKVTHDHSPVGEREDQGELSEQEAMRHPRRNEVWRSVGTEEHAPLDPDFVEIVELPFEDDSALLLCSDGLSDLVPQGEIARIVREHGADEHAVVRGLIAAANAAGGKDNVTVVFAAGETFARARAARAGALRPVPIERSAPVPRAAQPAWLRGRSLFFLLGVLAGLSLLAILSRIDSWSRRASALPQAIAPAAVVPRTLKVGPGAEFATIADALGSSVAGDTVLVAPGIYRERLRLEEGVALLGEVPRQAVLAPPADGSSPVVGIVAEGVSSARIAGFAITGSSTAPLDIGILLHAATVTVDDVEVRGARVAGVVVEEGAAATLRGSSIHDNPGAGVLVRSRAAPRIAHNVVSGNGGAGVDIEPGATATLTGNVIAGNAAEGVRGVPPAARAAVLADNVFAAHGRSNGRGAVR